MLASQKSNLGVISCKAGNLGGRTDDFLVPTTTTASSWIWKASRNCRGDRWSPNRDQADLPGEKWSRFFGGFHGGRGSVRRFACKGVCRELCRQPNWAAWNITSVRPPCAFHAGRTDRTSGPRICLQPRLTPVFCGAGSGDPPGLPVISSSRAVRWFDSHAPAWHLLLIT
jgi:hypothetical protein